MDREVVIVAINYRLGPIGFLSMGTEEVPGKLILSILYFYIKLQIKIMQEGHKISINFTSLLTVNFK